MLFLRVDCLNICPQLSFYLFPCSGMLYLGSPKQLLFPGYTQGYMDAIGIPVTSWMFQEISKLHSFKLLLLLHMCIRGCIPAERMIWVFIWNKTQDVFARNKKNIVRNNLEPNGCYSFRVPAGESIPYPTTKGTYLRFVSGWKTGFSETGCSITEWKICTWALRNECLHSRAIFTDFYSHSLWNKKETEPYFH